MASGAVVRKVQKRAVVARKVAPKAAEVTRTYSPEFLAEHEAVMARVREEGPSPWASSTRMATFSGTICPPTWFLVPIGTSGDS